MVHLHRIVPLYNVLSTRWTSWHVRTREGCQGSAEGSGGPRRAGQWGHWPRNPRALGPFGSPLRAPQALPLLVFPRGTESAGKGWGPCSQAPPSGQGERAGMRPARLLTSCSAPARPPSTRGSPRVGRGSAQGCSMSAARPPPAAFKRSPA